MHQELGGGLEELRFATPGHDSRELIIARNVSIRYISSGAKRALALKHISFRNDIEALFQFDVVKRNGRMIGC